MVGEEQQVVPPERRCVRPAFDPVDIQEMPDYIDDPPAVLASLRSICLKLPEAYEEPAWAGTRWRIRQRTFAHVRTADTDRGPVTWLKFRSRGPELDALLAQGHPFAPGGFGADVVAMIIGEGTDWTEVAELLTESYRLLAPRRLAARATTDSRVTAAGEAEQNDV
jgi:YjbR